MSTMLKIFAVLVVIGGLWVWWSGRSATKERMEHSGEAVVPLSTVVLGAREDGPFDRTGTILVDETRGQGGTYYLLYTEDAPGEAPKVRTKRLVFPSHDACAALGLPCATNQPAAPYAAGEQVRIIGTAEADRVEVSEAYRL